jgi:hypothetical protein
MAALRESLKINDGTRRLISEINGQLTKKCPELNISIIESRSVLILCLNIGDKCVSQLIIDNQGGNYNILSETLKEHQQKGYNNFLTAVSIYIADTMTSYENLYLSSDVKAIFLIVEKYKHKIRKEVRYDDDDHNFHEFFVPIQINKEKAKSIIDTWIENNCTKKSAKSAAKSPNLFGNSHALPENLFRKSPALQEKSLEINRDTRRFIEGINDQLREKCPGLNISITPVGSQLKLCLNKDECVSYLIINNLDGNYNIVSRTLDGHRVKGYNKFLTAVSIYIADTMTRCEHLLALTNVEAIIRILDKYKHTRILHSDGKLPTYVYLVPIQRNKEKAKSIIDTWIEINCTKSDNKQRAGSVKQNQTKKYKSIRFNRPKGFSQKQHCKGRTCKRIIKI